MGSAKMDQVVPVDVVAFGQPVSDDVILRSRSG
jgi:hypothetical protein